MLGYFQQQFPDPGNNSLLAPHHLHDYFSPTSMAESTNETEQMNGTESILHFVKVPTPIPVQLSISDHNAMLFEEIDLFLRTNLTSTLKSNSEDTVILDLILDRNPELNQDQLSIFKSAITCNDTLAELVVISSSEGVRALDIDYPKIYADSFEALIGALRIDCEREDREIRKVILNLMDDTIEQFNREVPVCPLKRVHRTSLKINFR
ncbi:hypothetical protein DAPPUDRAFT_263860 [Daphnia pulex]|uniref:RNase III domain-containing protein n=1 Tax=Daphnia pulex TaxID=6669 RepID=E9HQI9_DAPPU|nr:hypothetical protein DAPPUDRAFT_263860 [Daphnia pulex]|eukprot:EFX65975.1 hypothetical protein DAPPUDRAFT_263860 [Daphnia pulex]